MISSCGHSKLRLSGYSCEVLDEHLKAEGILMDLRRRGGFDQCQCDVNMYEVLLQEVIPEDHFGMLIGSEIKTKAERW